jgi:transcriptional regulator with XRE-family HTH domain
VNEFGLSPVSIGSVLRGEAARRGISYASAAKQIGVSQPTFSRWANGDNPPAAKYWAKIARFLGTTRAEVAELASAERLARSGRGRDQRLDDLERRVAKLEETLSELVNVPDEGSPNQGRKGSRRRST